ncbi:hypothetical protein BU15DRAFT_71192 [Melanogaster broomeanus]|nr:hypothetical protein BU15DRAFT_71192 [Melanogaster broomeanus]
MAPTSNRSTTAGAPDNPPSSPTSTTNTRKSTRKSTSEISKSKDTIAALPTYKVSNATSGAVYLNKSLLSLVGEPFTTEHLATTLFHITQMDKMPLAAIEAIRAVAFLLEEESTSKIATSVTAHLQDQTSKAIVTQVISAISPHIANILTTSDSLKENLEDIKQIHGNLSPALNTVLTRLDEVESSFTLLKPSLDAAQTCLDNVTSKAKGIPTSAPRSYSDVTRTSTPSPTLNHAAIARAAIRARQILFDPLPEQSLYTPTSSPAEVAASLNEAIISLRTEESPTDDYQSHPPTTQWRYPS